MYFPQCLQGIRAAHFWNHWSSENMCSLWKSARSIVLDCCLYAFIIIKRSMVTHVHYARGVCLFNEICQSVQYVFIDRLTLSCLLYFLSVGLLQNSFYYYYFFFLRLQVLIWYIIWLRILGPMFNLLKDNLVRQLMNNLRQFLCVINEKMYLCLDWSSY